jgi:hypothetical protein
MKRVCLRMGSDLPAVEFIFIAGGDAEKVVAFAASSESSRSRRPKRKHGALGEGCLERAALMW